MLPRYVHAIVAFVLGGLGGLPGSVLAADNGGSDPSCKNILYLKTEAKYLNPQATYEVGQMFLKGHCVPKDERRGYELVMRAARLGHNRAQLVVGILLHMGGEDSAALVWALRSAQQGDADGQQLAADMYSTGKNVAHNFVEGAKWALRSAKQGNSLAQAEIADFYNQGVGVEKNPIEADKWLILSIRTGVTMSDNVTQLKLASQTAWERAMSPTEVAEAHRRADAWKPKPETHAPVKE